MSQDLIELVEKSLAPWQESPSMIGTILYSIFRIRRAGSLAESMVICWGLGLLVIVTRISKFFSNCPRCPQSQDSFGRHTLACHMLGGKTILHNMIRDEIYRTLQGGKLDCKLEPNHLLPDLPAQRPADILTVPTALCK